MDARTAIGGGVVLGALVVVWQVVSVGAGLTAVFIPVATLLQVVVLVATLARTRADHGYGAQVGVGSVVSGVAAAMIFVGSVATLTVVFPDALPPEAPGAVAQATGGVIGTLVTGVVVSALAAIGLRAR